jgi:hypothetical protein
VLFPSRSDAVEGTLDSLRAPFQIVRTCAPPSLFTVSTWAAAQVIKDGTSRLIVTKPPKAHGNRRTLERAARESRVMYPMRIERCWGWGDEGHTSDFVASLCFSL